MSTANFKITKAIYPIDGKILQEVFERFGTISTILVQKEDITSLSISFSEKEYSATVSFREVNAAAASAAELEGRYIYPDCCQINFTNNPNNSGAKQLGLVDHHPTSAIPDEAAPQNENDDTK